jgi:hypothetical protein
MFIRGIRWYRFIIKKIWENWKFWEKFKRKKTLDI